MNKLLKKLIIQSASTYNLVITFKNQIMNNNIDIHIQGPIEAFRFDGDPGNFPLIPRGVTLGIANNSYVALPDISNMHSFTAQYETALREILGINQNIRILNPIFYAWESHFFLAEEGIQVSSKMIADQLNGRNYNYMPYQHTNEVNIANQELQTQGLKINVGLPPAYNVDNNSLLSNRSGWGRSIENPNELSMPEKFGINYPLSFTINSIDDIETAYNLLFERTQNPTAFIKIEGSAGGFGVFKVESCEDLNAVIQNLKTSDQINRDSIIQVQTGMNISNLFSVQYRDGEIITPGYVSEQVVDNGGHWYMNIFNTSELSVVSSDVRNQFNNFRNACRTQGYELQGWGGLDGGVVEGRASFLEHNSLRLTGAIPGIELARSLGIDKLPFAFGKVQGHNLGEFRDAWEILKRNNLALSLQDKSGIFPALWVDHGAYILIAGENRSDVIRQYNEARDLFVNEGLLELEG